MTARRLENKAALVTGAASGIGAEIAALFRKEGARLVLTDCNDERAAAIDLELGDDGCFVTHDVTKEEDWRRVVEIAQERLGGFHVLVNAAGVMHPLNIEQTTCEQWRSIMDVNAGGVFLGCKTAIAAMKAGGCRGAIVNIGSTAAQRTASWIAAYGASKAAVSSLTHSVALHCAESGYGIRCNALLPGVVHTPMIDRMLEASEDRDSAYAALVATNPMGRLIEAREVAQAALYLACDESSGVNGVTLPVDGGHLAA